MLASPRSGSYNKYMARGWESKSVEAQMESARNDSSKTAQPLTGDEKKLERERQNLLLSRSYVQHQIESSGSERYKESLQQALNEIDQKLSRLNGHR